jgi:uncharacterized membrane protein YfcA
VPAAFCGVLVSKALGRGVGVQEVVQIALGIALLLAVAGLVLRTVARLRAPAPSTGGGRVRVTVRPLPTVVLGALGGLVVGMTSVGSGSLIIVALLALYPMLRPNDLVGTDLVQAVPLVASAAVGHLLFGDFQFAVTSALLIGSIPGALLGATISSRAPGGLIRGALAVVLLASGLKLLHVPNQQLIIAVPAALALGVVAWVVLRRRLTRPRPALAEAETPSYETV